MKEIWDEALKQQLITSSGYLAQFSFDATPHIRLFRFAAGEYLIKEGNRPTYLFYLARGRAKLYVTLANGKSALIDFLAAPCFVGEIELVDQQHEARAVQAIENCWCLALQIEPLRTQLLNDAFFLHKLCVFLSKKLCRNIVSSTQNQAFPLANRLAAFILLTQNEGVYREKHTQVAEYLGVSYRHLLYVLAQFTRAGLLEKQNRDYIIRDRNAITALVRAMASEEEK